MGPAHQIVELPLMVALPHPAFRFESGRGTDAIGEPVCRWPSRRQEQAQSVLLAGLGRQPRRRQDQARLSSARSRVTADAGSRSAERSPRSFRLEERAESHPLCPGRADGTPPFEAVSGATSSAPVAPIEQTSVPRRRLPTPRRGFAGQHRRFPCPPVAHSPPTMSAARRRVRWC